MTDALANVVLDLSGLRCPLPLLKAKQQLHKMDAGETLRVIATDAGSVRDFAAYVNQSDHEMVETFTEDDAYIYVIRKG